MSIVRVGLSETKNFSEGYEAIFGKRKPGKKKKASAKAGMGKKKRKGKKK